jgi:PQQ-dependent catabolism-associated beta-propeller protein
MTRAPTMPVAGIALLALAGACARERDDVRAPASARIVVVDASGGTGSDARAARGATLAAEEAERAGRLVGRRIEVTTVRSGSPTDAAAAAGRALDAAPTIAVVGGFDPATCRALDALAAERHVLWVNVGCADAALRDAERHPAAFHVAATEAMARGTSAPADGAPVLWHAALERYGAAQLNERFMRRFGTAMDAPAWAGWMAVKLIAEAALRSEPRPEYQEAATASRAVGTDATPSAATVAAFLVRPDVAFDGHKGEPLRFGADDRQLRQPVYARGAARPGVGGDARRAAPPDGPDAVHAELPARVGDDVPLLVVTNEGSASLTVLDARTRAVLGVIPLGHRPRGAQATADGRHVLVALSDASPNAEGDGDAIVILDPRTGRERGRHRAGSDPEQFALAPDGSRLYAANEDAGLATVTDLRTGAAVASLPVGIEPEGVAVSPDGRWVYVTAETSNTVSVIDTRGPRVVASFLVDVRPRAVAFSPDGRRAYVTNEISGTVSVVDARRHAVVGTVAIGERAKPVGVVVAPDGRTVYVACGGTHAVAVLDAAGTVAATIPVGRRPWGIAVSPDGRWLYTANGGSGDVSVVDAAARRVVRDVPVGERPWGVTWVPAVRDPAPPTDRPPTPGNLHGRP